MEHPGQHQFSSSRAGARNATGVAFQARYTALAVLLGLDGKDVVRAIPEGDEDVDLILDRQRVHVQVKFRSSGLSLNELAQAIAKAWRAAESSSSRMDDFSIAIVSNVKDFAGLPPTGWASPIGAEDTGLTPVTALLKALQKMLGVGQEEALQIVSRTFLVTEQVSPETLASAVRLKRSSFSQQQALFVGALLVSRVLDAIRINKDASPATAAEVNWQDLALVLDDGALLAGAWLHEVESKRLLVPTNFWSAPAEDRGTFLRGLNATPSHIGAGYPVARPVEETRIRATVENGKGTFIIGQSGSGKSTLLWQVANSLIDQFACYTLNRGSAEDASDLVKLVSILSSQSPILICIDDFQPSLFPGWATFASGVSHNPNVRILVSCREEYFNPTNLAGGLKALRPTLTEKEALTVIDALRQGEAKLPEAEVRQLYEDSRGLMMELVYLATTSDRLENTLREQGGLLRASPDELPARLARLVLTADICGFDISTEDMRRFASSDSELGRAIDHLISEHILLENGRRLTGLHHVRSHFLVASLHATYPPIESTLLDLFSLAPTQSLTDLARLWIRRNAGSMPDLVQALARRFAREEKLDWNEIAETSLVVEAASYALEFESMLPLGERSHAESYLLAVGNGRASFIDGALWDLGATSFTSPAIKERLKRLTNMRDIFDGLPKPYPIRKMVINALRDLDALSTANLTVSALNMLCGTNSFTSGELRPLSQRIVSATSVPDADLDYGDWMVSCAKSRMSRAWAVRAAAGVARVGEAGREALRLILGTDVEGRARWALEHSVHLVDCSISGDNAHARVVVPQAMLSGTRRQEFILAALHDAADIAGLPMIDALLLTPDGEPLKESSTSEVILQGRAGGAENKVFGYVLLDEYRAGRQTTTWFEWMDSVASLLAPVVDSLENSISLALAQLHANKKLISLSVQYRNLGQLHEELKWKMPEPPASRLLVFDHRDLLATWAFGALTLRSISYHFGDIEATASKAFKTGILSVIDEMMRALQSLYVGGLHNDAKQFHRLNLASTGTYFMLQTIVDQFDQVQGSRAADLVSQMAACYESLHVVLSSDEITPEFDATKLTHGIAPSRNNPSLAVTRLLQRMEIRADELLSKERQAAMALATELGPSWQVVPVRNWGELSMSVAPLWAFLAPAVSVIDGPHILATFARNPWAGPRSILALRRLDGSVMHLVRPMGKWPELGNVPKNVVLHQLRTFDDRLGGSRDPDQDWKPLAQFLLLVDVFSREMASRRLGGPMPPPWKVHELSALGAAMPVEAKALLSHLKGEAEEGPDQRIRPLSIAQRLSDPNNNEQDALLECVLRCQASLVGDMA